MQISFHSIIYYLLTCCCKQNAVLFFNLADQNLSCQFSKEGEMIKLTVNLPAGETKIPEPMMVPTMMVTPLKRVIFLLSETDCVSTSAMTNSYLHLPPKIEALSRVNNSVILWPKEVSTDNVASRCIRRLQYRWGLSSLSRQKLTQRSTCLDHVSPQTGWLCVARQAMGGQLQSTE